MRGVVVFDGPGVDREFGSLSVRYAPDADSVLERLAAEHRATEQVLLVSSDLAVRGTSGQEVMKVTSKAFAAELGDMGAEQAATSRIADRLDRRREPDWSASPQPRMSRSSGTFAKDL